MDFLIEGVNFLNKGAELMLYAIQEQVQEWDSENTTSLNIKVGNFQQRNQANVNHLLWLNSRKVPVAASTFNQLATITPKNIRERHSLALESEIDVVLDASGFLFSDQWGAEATEDKLKIFSRWRKQGKKIILMPQAFGPFTSERIKQAFTKIIDCVDLIFARDKVSFKYINKLNSEANNVKIAPDFTNLLQGLNPSYIDSLIGRPCIIPNSRMLDKTSSAVSSNYLSSLSSIIEYLSQKDLKPFILIHEADDYQLGKDLQSRANEKITLIKEDNPLYLKGILGKSSFVISSRFHGLVSALSQATPCIGTGWSHKYQMLFKDYNCLDLLVNFDNNINDTLGKLDLLIDESTRVKVIQNLEVASQHQKALSKQMWHEVRQVVAV